MNLIQWVVVVVCGVDILCVCVCVRLRKIYFLLPFLKDCKDKNVRLFEEVDTKGHEE